MNNYDVFKMILAKWRTWFIFSTCVFLLVYIYFLSGTQPCFVQRRNVPTNIKQSNKNWAYGSSGDDSTDKDSKDKCEYKQKGIVITLSIFLSIFFVSHVYLFSFNELKNDVDMVSNLENKLGATTEIWKNVVLVVYITFFVLLPLVLFLFFIGYLTHFYLFYPYYDSGKASQTAIQSGFENSFYAFIFGSMIYTIFMIASSDDDAPKINIKKILLPSGIFISATFIYALYNFIKCPSTTDSKKNNITCSFSPIASFAWIMIVLNLAIIGAYQGRKINRFGIFLYYFFLILLSAGMIYYNKKF